MTRTVTQTTNYRTVDINQQIHNNEVENQRRINEGLSKQLEVYNDLQRDVARYDAERKTQDRERDAMQARFAEAEATMKKMSADHKAQLDKQAQVISGLRADMQAEKQKAFD